MEENKSTGKTITIVILILIILGLTGYIVYTDYYQENNKKTTYVEEDDENEEREMNVSEEAKIEEKLNDYLYLADNFDGKDVKEYDNQQLLFFAIDSLGGFKEDFTKDEVDQKLEDYFGSNIKINHEDIICPVENVAIYKYDTEKGYVLNSEHPGHGGFTSSSGEVHPISGTVKKDKYILKTRILYTEKGDYTNGSKIYYATLDDLNKHNPIITEETEEQNYKDVKSYLPITTFTFTKKGEDYYLKSVKREN